MEKNKGKVKLNDELLDAVSGGTGEYPISYTCDKCGRTIMNGDRTDHAPDCIFRYASVK